MQLSEALRLATDELYVSLSNQPIVITSADISALEERMRVAMAGTGYAEPFVVEVSLDDAAEFIDVKVTSGGVEEMLGLKSVTPDGRIMVYVDTDGDGR